MRKKQTKRILSFLLSCMLALNTFAPSASAAELQPAGTQTVGETQDEILDEPAGTPENSGSGNEESGGSAGTADDFLLDVEVMPENGAASASALEEEESETETDVLTEAELETATDVLTEAGSESETEAGTESETDVQTEAGTESGTDVQTEAEFEPGTETYTEAESEPGTETYTEAGSESETEICTEVVFEYETDVLAEAESESETEALTEAESESETEMPGIAEIAESETETEAPEMKPASVQFKIGRDSEEILDADYDETSHTYTCKVPLDKIKEDGNLSSLAYVKVAYPDAYYGYLEEPMNYGATFSTSSMKSEDWWSAPSSSPISLGDMTVGIEVRIQIGAEDKWNSDEDPAKAQIYTIRIQSEKPLSARPAFSDDAVTEYAWPETGEAQPLTCPTESYEGTLTYQWYEQQQVEDTTEQVEIAGAASPAYTPTVNEAGTYYYYLKLTGQQDGKEPVSVMSKKFTVSIVGTELVETNQKTSKKLSDFTLDVELPWSTELLKNPDPTYPLTLRLYVIQPVGYSRVTSPMTVEWYQSEKATFDDSAKPYEAGEISNSSGSFKDEAGNKVSASSFWCYLPPTTVTGTTYYFAKVKLSIGEFSKEQIFGPARVTITAPDSVPYGVIVGEEPVGYVNLSIEDSTKTRTDLKNGMGETVEDIGPAGTFLKLQHDVVSNRRIYPIYPSDSMMTVIARACLGSGLVQEGAEKNYITKIAGKINGVDVSRAEFDRGQQSGWMGSLNDWIMGRGFQEYTVKDGWLKDGDTIKLLYTTDLGADLGGGFGQKESYELNALEVNSGGYTQLQPAFNKDNVTYEAYSDGSVAVTATAENKQMRVRIFKGEEEYRAGKSIPAEEGDVLQVVVCNPDWVPHDESELNQAMAKIYTVNIIGSDALPTSKVKITAVSGEGTELSESSVSLTKNVKGSWMGRGAKPPYVYLKSNLGMYAVDPAKNPVKAKITLTGMPEDAEAVIVPAEGEGAAQTFEKTQDGLTAVLSDGLTGVGTWYYRILLQMNGKTIVYWLQLTKSSHALGRIDLNGSPAFGTIQLNGQPEGTLFQINGEGEQTGAAGFAQDVFEYNLYVTPGIRAIGPKTSSGITAGDLGKGSAALYVGDQEVLSADSISALCTAWYNAFETTVPITQDETRVRLQWTNSADPEDEVNYYLHVIRQAYNVSELEALINGLPAVDALEYARDYSAVLACQTVYDSLDDAQKKELSDAAAAKLNAALAILEKQKETGEKQISDLLALVDSYKETVTAGTEMTDELYQQHGANIRKSWQDHNLLNGWVAEEFASKYRDYENAISAAYKIVNRYEIAAGSRTDKATNYEDDFMVSGNAYNLTLGAPENAYPITFRDIMYSNGSNEGKPYNTPGKLKYTIADPSIVTIKEELTTYKDMGVGGGGSYDNLKYYLIPQKAGTTTLTVNLADDKGTYYGQIPRIIIHVNNPDEAAVEDADKKLTDFYSQKHTTKYDTWHYIEETGGAPFTFHVYGKDPQVWVWPADGSGEKTSYPVAADGSVTVYLKDGYNPIEVTGTLDGRRVTQVYGLRGKAISYTVENKYRPGQPLRQGDTAVIRMVGINIPVHKILRIYNPWGGVIWEYDTVGLPGQGTLRATTELSQYGIGHMEVQLTGSGRITLTNGRIEEGWIGSGLYAEGGQGSMGGLSGQADNTFSHLPDIELDVAAAPEFQQVFRIHPQLLNEGVVRAGEKVSIEIPDLPVSEITDAYPFATGDIKTKFQNAQTVFASNIPGLSQVQSARIDNPGTAQGAESALRGLKTIVFTVPEDTPSGIYRICGGYVNVKHGDASWTIDDTRMFKVEMSDLDLQIVNPRPGAHTCDWGEGVVTKEAACTEDGVRTWTCSICGETKTETIPSLGGHKYDSGKVVQEAACAAGIRIYTCSVCGQTKTESIPAVREHSFGEWTTSVAATVFVKEEQTRSCSICGKKETREGEKLEPTITLNAQSVPLKVKQSTKKLKVSGLAAGDSVVSWESANEKIAKVNSKGKITAGKKKGTTTITIRLASGLTKTVKVTVQKKAVKTKKITGLKKTLTLEKGEKTTLKPVVNPFTSLQKFSYSSSKKSVATVTAKGVIKAKKAGKTTITVKSGSKKFKIKVTVK